MKGVHQNCNENSSHPSKAYSVPGTMLMAIRTLLLTLTTTLFLHISRLSFRGFSLLFFFFFFFLGMHLRYMEIPRLRVELELQLPAYATATAMPDTSHVCGVGHRNAISLTYWVRPGIYIMSSWVSSLATESRNFLVYSSVLFRSEWLNCSSTWGLHTLRPELPTWHILRILLS